MKRLIALALVVFPALAFDHDDRDWKHEEQETIRRSFPVSGTSGARKLLVDNFTGYVHVTGASGSEVQVTIQKHIRAESTEAVAEAKREVKLDISQQGNFVRLYVDGPWRSSNGNNNHRGDRYYGYSVEFDYDIQVPPDTELVLKTFNRGNIEVKGTAGDFDVHNFNGGIDMQEIGGSGSVDTFNGPVKVAFARNPARAATFKTFNGSIDVYLQPGLDADLQFKTFHGGVYSDFDVTTLPSVVSGEIESGRFVYRSSDHAMKVRAGKGGTALSFDTFNGSIRLHSKAL